MNNMILQGDALTKLKELSDESIDCVMTSPPYWALRDYGTDVESIWDSKENCEHDWGNHLSSPGSRSNDDSNHERKEVFGKRDNWNKSNFCQKCGAWKGQLGLEPTFDLYIKHLCDIFDEIKRVLKKSGTCWVNLGDTYGGSGNSSGHTEDTKNLGYTTNDMGASKGNKEATKGYEKCLVMIPQRFAIEMVNRGWILRNNIIWHKRNCMPSSVKDRFTVDFEYLFFFTKNKKYYFETQYEPLSENSDIEYRQSLRENKDYNSKEPYTNNFPKSFNSKGRNKRTVWTINPKPFKEAHFAVYPEELCETPIKAGCPEFVCVNCGSPKEKEYDKKLIVTRKTKDKGKVKDVLEAGDKRMVLPRSRTGVEGYNEFTFKGYKPTCNCNSEFTSGIVLDPFFGSGTTGVVALKQNKKFIGIELNKEYIEIANKRLKPFMEQTKLVT